MTDTATRPSAINQARKEINQRFDFKGTHNEINLENDCIVILAAVVAVNDVSLAVEREGVPRDLYA